MFEKYGADIYVSGMKVFTTLRLADQKAALNGVRQGILEFHRRRGYAGPEGKVEFPPTIRKRTRSSRPPCWIARSQRHAARHRAWHQQIAHQGALAQWRRHRFGRQRDQIRATFLSDKMAQDKRLTRGSIVRVARIDPDAPWQISYLPQVEVAFVALAPANGAVRAMVGGFDFSRNQFNHVTQAWRQAGFQLQAVRLFGRAGTRHHARPPCSRMRRSSRRRPKPAASVGNRKTMTERWKAR
jgi:penicillin-binding protein 1A